MGRALVPTTQVRCTHVFVGFNAVLFQEDNQINLRHDVLKPCFTPVSIAYEACGPRLVVHARLK